MIEIEWKPFILQLKVLAFDIRRMARALDDAEEPLEKSVNKVVTASIVINFALQGRPSWRPLEPSTIRKRGSSRPILIHSNKLFRHAVSKQIWRITNDKADMDKLDNLVPYARFHQTGTKFMPMREFAALQTADIDRIEEVFEDWIHKITVVEGRWPP